MAKNANLDSRFYQSTKYCDLDDDWKSYLHVYNKVSILPECRRNVMEYLQN